MEIVIFRKDRNTILNQAEIFWKISTRKYLIRNIGLGVVGILTFVINEILSSKEHPSVNMLFSALGIALIFCASSSFGLNLRSKGKYDLNTFQLINRLIKSDKRIELKITDNEILYNDFELKSEMKWSFFTHYRFYKDHLYILTSDYFRGIVVSKNEMSQEQFIQLSDFVVRRLKERR